MHFWQLSKQLLIFPRCFLPLLVLTATAIALPSCVTNQPSKPFSSEALPSEAIAEIGEIRNYPVRVRYTNSATYRPATVGVPLKVSESVATEVNSSAQINLRNGAIVRIGGVANVTIKPQNQVEISSGTLVAWANGERKAIAQIQAPFGEVSSNEGTIYIEIPAKAADERRVIALDGKVTVLLKISAKVVTLSQGEEIRIKANGSATEPKRIDKETIDKRIANNNLLFGFNNQLASISRISTEFGVQNLVKEGNKIEFRRTDLPSKPNSNTAANTAAATSNTERPVEQPSASNRSNDGDRYDRRDAPAPEPVRQPEVPAAANVPAPQQPAPVVPQTTAPVQPPPVTSSPVAPIAQPVEPPQPVPIDPPPAPVQPEIPAPARTP
jgi:hypothetical protein